MTTRRMKKRFAALSCTAVLLAISLLFSFGKPLGLPSWQDIYAAFGFTDVNPESGELSVHCLLYTSTGGVAAHSGGVD